MEAIRLAVADQQVAGVSVRVRWIVPDEDRHAIDREAIARLLDDAGAADCRLEGRIVPVLRRRAAGIAGLTGLPEKIRAWAAVSEVQPEPLLECLATLEVTAPEELAQVLLNGRN